MKAPFVEWLGDSGVDINRLVLEKDKYGLEEARKFVEQRHPLLIDYILIGKDENNNGIYYNKENNKMFVEFDYCTN